MMKSKNAHILTFSDKMQVCAVSCFAACDWFCPMRSHLRDIGTCVSKKLLMHSDVSRNALGDPKNSEMFCT